MRSRHAVLVLAAAASLAACDREQDTVTTERHLAVTGPRDSLERFVRLQGSRRPPLAVSGIETLADGRATATVTVPAEFDGEELGHTTREALAAGLSYEFDEAGGSTTVTR